MPHWRGGNGRDTMDRFLSGLPAFLAPGGLALITHHDLVGLQHTEELLATVGLKATCVFRWTVHEDATRMASVTDVSLIIENCPSAYQLGLYWFMDSRILRITHCDEAAWCTGAFFAARAKALSWFTVVGFAAFVHRVGRCGLISHRSCLG
jgi:hypothetical protein